ncbi:MAG: DUF177 domain-containing protein [Chloroflexi bacterium]|nr:DUF177 domain-containing protein [Chloroflexota bacterium]
MQFNVAHQLVQVVGATRLWKVEGKMPSPQGDGDASLSGEGDFLRTDRGILVRGTLQVAVTLQCSRCLEMFDTAVSFSIEEEFYARRNLTSGAALPPPDELEAFMIGEDNILDLGEAIRQYALMALPMNPVCREDCAGLCSVCGTNLNHGSCQCLPLATRRSLWHNKL